MTYFVICWDLDGTLGEFNLSARNVRLRRGIKETLHNFSKMGFLQYVTSNSPIEYVREAIEIASLTPYFVGALGVDEIESKAGKRYKPVADRHNFGYEEARSRMLVIGNSLSDKPVDLGVVFVHDTMGHYTSANVLEQLVHSLLEAGNENFYSGFSKLYNRSLLNKNSGQSVSFVDGIRFEFTYKVNPHTPDVVVPTISVGSNTPLLVKELLSTLISRLQRGKS